MDLGPIVEYLPALLYGAKLTIVVTFLAMAFGTIIGFIVALMRISQSHFARLVAQAYTGIIRGLPLLVQVLYIYFGLPLLLGIRMSALTGGTIAMSLFTGAFLSEIFRAGIASIDRGQLEASRSIGFSYWQSMRLVVMPQAIWRMIPALANQFSITLKDTSLLSVIGVTELTMAGQNIYSNNFDTIRVLTMVGIIYLIIFLVADHICRLIENKVRR